MPHHYIDDILRRLDGIDWPDGEPPYRDRVALRNALGTEAVIRLGVLCAERVRPVWERAFPADTEPIDVLHAALQGADAAAVKARIGRLQTRIDNVGLMGAEFAGAGGAAFAHWAAARDLLYGVPKEFEEDEGEIDVDSYDWSPCFIVSVVEAGGAVWEETGDPDKRRAFWRWYLREAVPIARA
ncbi:Imm5 family immunity protein [Lentzea kentuckyensis]|uniref:Imm5 family immunity protein n=1 Tax=Lentzea kentuckyensis TaxID=360086 RepID=UPI000A3C44BB|nr:Imm5 family immunity protein [Lentzea kentuckyensis]